jgi:hypothetical protein
MKNPNEAIQRLRAEGCTVTVRHYRIPIDEWESEMEYCRKHRHPPCRVEEGDGHTPGELREMGKKPSPMGGSTEVVIDHHLLTAPVYGSACCRLDENFCYHRGLQIALGRAIKALSR